jgi:KaiC/GvpD/RAD55 family RecA-like ATPase
MPLPDQPEPIILPPGFKRFVLLLGASKGGTGKSTLAVNLAVAAYRGGLKTIIFDTDIDGESGQESCMRWAKLRQEGSLVVRRGHRQGGRPH